MDSDLYLSGCGGDGGCVPCAGVCWEWSPGEESSLVEGLQPLVATVLRPEAWRVRLVLVLLLHNKDFCFIKGHYALRK